MWHNLAQLPRYRGLIQALVARDLKARYRGSMLGFFWSFINPLMLLSIYTFVFSTVMRNSDIKTTPYALFMFCGILPWTWFSLSVLESSTSLIAGGNLIKKVLFPPEVLPIVSVLSNMVHFFLGLTILVAFIIGYKIAGYDVLPDWYNLPWFPLIVLIQLIFTLGLALLLSSLTVHFRDIRDLLSNLMMLWFFSTPIIYPYFTPGLASYLKFFKLNPFFHLAVSYQEVLFFHGPGFAHGGHLKWLLVLGAASCVFFLAGYWVFDRLRDSFAETV